VKQTKTQASTESLEKTWACMYL